MQGVKSQVLINLHTSWRAEKNNTKWKYAMSRNHHCYVVTDGRCQGERNYHKY